MHRKGLVDAKDANNFNARLDIVEWNEGEFFSGLGSTKLKKFFFDQL